MAVTALQLAAANPSGRFPVHFYRTGTTTDNYTDNIWLFTEAASGKANPGFCHAIRIQATTADIAISFDGVNQHGFVPLNTTADFLGLIAGGISVKSNANGVPATFKITAW